MLPVCSYMSLPLGMVGLDPFSVSPTMTQQRGCLDDMKSKRNQQAPQIDGDQQHIYAYGLTSPLTHKHTHTHTHLNHQVDCLSYKYKYKAM